MSKELNIKRRMLMLMAETLIFDVSQLPKPLEEHSDAELEALVDEARTEADDPFTERK